MLNKYDISKELWREYEFPVIVDGTIAAVRKTVYRIEQPVTLFIRPGGTTHRVVDRKGVAHCCPAPGQFGCVLRWQNHKGKNPCNF